MSEWWTYALSDFLLFSPQTYYRLFELYNFDIWPAQIFSLTLGIAALTLSHSGYRWRGRVVAAILAGFWLWVAWAFHLQHYATINWAAKYFAAGFAMEALLLIWAGTVRNRLHFKRNKHIANRVGLCIFILALFVQPLIGPLAGRAWVQVEIVGVAPDPTVLATLGILLFATNRRSYELMLIPLLWCAISGATLWTMGAPDALVLPLTALVVLLFAGQKALSRQDQS